MRNFTEISGLPIYDLNSELTNMILSNKITWNNKTQICLNNVEENSDDVWLGIGSLTHDWDNSYIEVSDTGENRRVVPERKKKMHCYDFKYLCNQFKGTLFDEVYHELAKKFHVGRVRLMKSESKTCLSWHTDETPRVHYPIKTQPGCFMVIDNEIFHLPQNTWWHTNTIPLHTAFNASLETRIHLVAEIIEK
jgi:hypothetical protein